MRMSLSASVKIPDTKDSLHNSHNT